MLGVFSELGVHIGPQEWVAKIRMKKKKEKKEEEELRFVLKDTGR